MRTDRDHADVIDVIAELAAWQDAAEGPSENRIATTILDVAGMWWITIGGLRARVLDEDRFPWASWRYRVADALLRAQWTGNGIGVWLAQHAGGSR